MRLVQTREETFIAHRGRPWTEVKMKLGLKKDGKIAALALEATQAGGAYAGYGIITILYSGALMHGLYHIPAIKHDAWRVYTNLPPSGAMRGHGTVDTRAAFEALLTEMAEELGIDSLRIRQINMLPEIPYVTMYAQRVMSYGVPECLEKVKAASGWEERKGRLPKGRGLGIALSHFVSGTSTPKHWTGEPHATVNLKLDFDGGITLLTGAADIGQGSNTMASQVAAEVLGVRLDRIRVISADSALTPKDNGSYSSRVTFMVGNASISAAEELKGILVKAAAKKLDAREEDIEVIDELFMVSGSQDPGLTFQEVVKAAMVDSGTITVKGTFTCPTEFRATSASAAARSAPPWASAMPPRWSRPRWTRSPARSPRTRCGWRSMWARRSTRSRWKGRRKAACGWAWARRCRKRSSMTRAGCCTATSWITGSPP